MDLIGLLIDVIVFCIIGGLLYWLVMMLPIPEPFRTFIVVAVILIAILMLLSIVYGGGGYLPHYRLRG